MSLIDDIKSKVDILTGMFKLGISVPEKYAGSKRPFMIRCPLPGHEEQYPSFSVNPTKNYFRCFGCGKHGDVIDLAGLMLGKDNLAAIDFWKWECGIRYGDYHYQPPTDWFKKHAIKTLMNTTLDTTHGLLTSYAIYKRKRGDFALVDPIWEKLAELQSEFRDGTTTTKLHECLDDCIAFLMDTNEKLLGRHNVSL